jgi:NADH-quinone oxidoreductase subunit N
MAAVSVYYYFRLIQAMYFRDGEAAHPALHPGFKFALAGLAVITIVLGVFPGILTQWLYF